MTGNFFNVANIHKDIEVNKTSKTESIKNKDNVTEVNNNLSDDSQKYEHSECFICPNKGKDKEFCEKSCLRVKELYV